MVDNLVFRGEGRSRCTKKGHACAAKASSRGQSATYTANSGEDSQEGGFGPAERNAAARSSRHVGAAAALRVIFRTRIGLRARKPHMLAPRRPRRSPLAGFPRANVEGSLLPTYQYSARSGEDSQASVPARTTEMSPQEVHSRRVGAAATAAVTEAALHDPWFFSFRSQARA